MSDFLVPASSGFSEYSEKRSTFTGRLAPVQTEEQAKEFINRIKKQFPDARHNCWCYCLSDGIERYSDDGEPQGTAGLPMLGVFRRENVTNVVCVVTRYFGGILLGAPGLLRAYTKAAKDALDSAGIAKIIPWQGCSFTCDYAMASRIRAELDDSFLVENISYGQSVEFQLFLPMEKFDAFSLHIFDLSAGKISVRKTECKFLPQNLKEGRT